MKIKTDCIPLHQQFAQVPNAAAKLNKKALCIYAATGFFLGEDDFFENRKVLQPGQTYTLDEQGAIKHQEAHFKWQYQPRNISFQTAVDEFTDLYEQILKEQAAGHKVLLPLSGGLDSRSQAAGLKHIGAEVSSYSYAFTRGYPEHQLSEKIARVCAFPFQGFLIPPGYLWSVIEDLVKINSGYSEFTHARQMAVLDAFKQMQGEFSLGHWGDVLFDRGIAAADEGKDDVVILYKKIIKKGGLALAEALWKQWELAGDFQDYLKSRLSALLAKIEIEHQGARIRAFKSLYWAPRWTSINLQIFEQAHPIHLPYYDERMCRFIMELPESFLADRRIQIAYIKQRNPGLAKITWQAQKPFNLYTYSYNKMPYNLTYRVQQKLKRSLQAKLGQSYVQRNWELQFLGTSNEQQLQTYLTRKAFVDWVGAASIDKIYKGFKKQDAVFYSHPLSMLLTLSAWQRYGLSEHQNLLMKD